MDLRYCFRRIAVWLVLALPTVGGYQPLGAQVDNKQIQSKGNVNDIDPWTVEHFQLASEAQRQNKLEVAEKEYLLILSRRPRFAEVHQNLGIVYHQQREYRKAVKTLQTAVSLKPDLLGAQLFLGIDKYMIQEFQGALLPLEKALRLNPAERQAGLYLAFAYLALDSPEKATRQLRRTAKYFPDDVEIAYHLGDAYLEGVRQRMTLLQQAGEESALRHWALAAAAERKGDSDGTILQYLKALAIEPKIVDLYWSLAVAFRKADVSDLAKAALQRYASLNPDRDLAAFNPGGTAGELPGNQQAVAAHKEDYQRLWESLPVVERGDVWPGIADEVVNQAIKKHSLSGGSELETSIKLYQKGDFKGAAESIKKRVNRLPGDWPIAFLQARSYFLASDYDAAEQVLEGALLNDLQFPSVALLRLEIESQLALRYFGLVVAKEPDSERAKLLMAKSYGATGRTKEAISTYQEILKQAPDRLGIHLAIAQLYEDELKWPAAIEELNAELALAPDNALALAHLGHAYTESQDADQAIQVLTRLLAAHPEDGRAYADLGKAWSMKQDSSKAIEAFERALLYDSTQHQLHYRLFQLYGKRGDKARANNHLAAFKAGEFDKQKKLREATADLSKK